MPEDLGERTELPTQRRLGEARSRGQIAKSQEFASAIDLMGSVVLLMLGGGLMVRALLGLVRRALESDGAGWSPESSTVWPSALRASVDGLSVVTPVLLISAGVSYLSHFVQVGWLVTTKPLVPKLSKLNPIEGMRRLLGRRNAVKAATSSVKLALVLAIAWTLVSGWMARVAGLPSLDAEQGLILIAKMVLELALWLAAVLLLIGLADWLYHRWQHQQDLRMTKQQVKDERRTMEGDPQVKGRRLRMMRDIAMHRIQQSVPLADVVVTNPTHFAVALRYDAERMRAPKVVAKGADLMAQRIRIVAAGAGVPIVERPPLARGLFYGVEVGQEIRAEFFEAVAEILAYVYRMDKRAGGGRSAARAPGRGAGSAA